MSERLEVATLGEVMAVMDPVSRGSLKHISTFAKRIGGAELNVAMDSPADSGTESAGEDTWETTSLERKY